MARRSGSAIALAVVVVLAGCGGFPGGPDVLGLPDGSPTPSPTPTPTPTPSLSEVTMPPGVSESGVTDADALLSAHGDALAGEPVTVSVAFLLTVNGTGQNISFTGKTVPGSDRGWIRVRLADGVGTYYTAGGTTYKKEVVDGQTTYGTTDRVSALPRKPRFGSDARIRTAIESANWTADGVVVRNGTTLIRLVATDVEPPPINASADATVSSRGVLLVDQQGVVHHVEVHSRVETDSGTVVYGLEVTLSDIGTTTIEPPEWLDEAKGS